MPGSAAYQKALDELADFLSEDMIVIGSNVNKEVVKSITTMLISAGVVLLLFIVVTVVLYNSVAEKQKLIDEQRQIQLIAFIVKTGSLSQVKDLFTGNLVDIDFVINGAKQNGWPLLLRVAQENSVVEVLKFIENEKQDRILRFKF